MTLSVSPIAPIRRDITLMIDRTLSKETQQKLFVSGARQILADIDAKNLAVLGRAVAHQTFVDGARSEVIDNAQRNIVREYDLIGQGLKAIGDLLWRHSPVRKGDYRRSHHLYADGALIATVSEGWMVPKIAATVRELLFVPTVEYARGIERGRSKQAPSGVYHVVADISRPALRGIGKVTFTYRLVNDVKRKSNKRRRNSPQDLRQPAIVIRLN